MKFSICNVTLMVAALTISTAALARTIDVPQSEFGVITSEQRKEIEDQLKQHDIIKPGDSLHYSGSDINQKDLDPATIAIIVGTVGPIVCKWVVEAIADEEKASCRGTKEARASCATRVDKNAAVFLGLCGVIKVTDKK